MADASLILALPKGRLLDEALPILARAGITPDAAIASDDSRQLRFKTNHAHIDVIRVRSFDVATFVAFGAAQMGICGLDDLMEFDYPDIYAPLDLGVGKCRLAIAARTDQAAPFDLARLSHIRIATKYPNVTGRWFAERGVQAECIKLNGAMELAPVLNLSPYIVDLVSTGATLKANGLKEVATIAEISARLIVNRTALKVRAAELNGWIDRCRTALAG
ncbi:MAG: ATP phosphoribosyltransferase [Alphaproteobacteria bacterium]|nr:ATP phosphoribosyltransferase [Alphaproteobacteria bacterium]